MAEGNAVSVPDLYVDGLRITVTPYGVVTTYSLNEPHPEQSRPPVTTPQCIIRMSLEHAKTLAMILRKQLKDYERANGKIPLPPGLYTNLGVAEEDWGLE